MADRLQPTYRTKPDGEVVICLGDVRGTVSSWHLVPGKLAQLRRLLRTCPACKSLHVQITITHRRTYGYYRRLECCVCGHRWTQREATTGPAPAERQQCPECSSTNTTVIESRVTTYGRRRRVSCHDCNHRWTNVLGGQLQPRPQARRAAGELTEDEVRLILTDHRSDRELAQVLLVSRTAVRAVRRGELHAQVAPELPRQQAQPARLSCTSCRFWDPDAVRPCKEGWPDPETDGPGYANECGDYLARS